MKDSSVIVFTGARGGGKTASAAVQAAIDMVVFKQTVVSNVPISFLFCDDDGSKPKLYQSLPLSVDKILGLDESLRDCIILWDEMPLWLYSRQSNSVLNRLAGLILTLLRKRALSLYVTAQFLRMIDSNVRIQMDAEVRCQDMSFKWPNLSRGELIQQTILDVSGRFTGETYEETRRTYPRLLHLSNFFGIFDTLKAFDIYDAQVKYKVDSKVKVITRGDADNAYTPDYVTQVQEMLSGIAPGRYEADEIQGFARETIGADLDNRVLGRLLKAAGAIYKKTSTGYCYEIVK